MSLICLSVCSSGYITHYKLSINSVIMLKEDYAPWMVANTNVEIIRIKSKVRKNLRVKFVSKISHDQKQEISS